MGLPVRRLRISQGRRHSPAEMLATGIGTAGLLTLTCFIAVPLVSLVVATAATGAWAAVTTPTALQALVLSAKTTAATMAVLLVFGTPAAYVLARVDFPGNRLINTFVDLPMALPPSAAGIALLLAFGRQGLLGQHLQAFGVTVSFTTTAVVVAQTFVAAPFYVRQAAAGFVRVDHEVEEAALTDGGGRLTVFFRVTGPLVSPALIAGALTAWARALGEFGATIIFAGNFAGTTQTIPLAIYAQFQSDLDGAIALSVVVLGVAFVVLLGTRLLTGAASRR